MYIYGRKKKKKKKEIIYIYIYYAQYGSLNLFAKDEGTFQM